MELTTILQLFLIAYFILANTIYLGVLVFGFIHSRTRYLETRLNMVKKLTPMRSMTPISILVPCYNEEKSVFESIQSMLNIDYPDFEVVVCNDGSKDRTLDVLIAEFSLKLMDDVPPQILPSANIRGVYCSSSHSRLIVIDKENGGKADALNAGINLSNFPLICCVDADSLLDSEGLARVAFPFFEDPDRIIATGGTITLINTEADQNYADIASIRKAPISWRWLDMIQSMEYLRAFLVGRMGWDYLGCTTIISGAFGLFRKSSVIKVGGYARGSVGEDMELLLRLHAYSLEHQEAYEVHFLPDPVCMTEAPSDLGTLGRQRSRWQQGLCDSLWRTRRVIFNRKCGLLGFIGLPYLAIFEAFSAPLEIFGYGLIAYDVMHGQTNLTMVFLFLTATAVFGAVLNLGALIIDQATFRRYERPSDLIKLIVGALIEQLGFRHLHLIWRLQGIYRWLRGKNVWGHMQRRGLGQSK